MWAARYLEALGAKLQSLKSDQAEAMSKAAEAMADALAQGGMIYVFGCGHSAALSMDIFYRAGGLMLVEPIFGEEVLLNWRPVTETSAWERKEGYAPRLFQDSGARAGDVMIVVSNSGRNAAPVDMALAAAEAGLTVIAVTSISAAQSLPSRHSSGKRLHQAADIAIDNHVDAGDAAIEIPGFAPRVGPMSTALASALLQAVVVETIALLVKRGETPPVFVSSNVPGGDEHNRELLAKYRHRIRYL